MRILILTNSDMGLYRFRKELLQELIHPGTIIAERKTLSCEVIIAVPQGAYISQLERIGCKVIKTPIDRRGMNILKDLKLVYQYTGIINRVKPDVVLTYTIKPNIYGGILCGLKRISYIPNITGLGTSIENEDFMSKVILLMYKIGLRSAKRVFFQNVMNKKYFIEKRIVKSGTLLPGSGVNLDENNFESYPEETGDLRFLFVGRIMRNKGISEFLDCAEYIKKKYKFTHFDILGDFEEEEYRPRIEKLHREGVICYYGQQDDVHSFMKTHHATILPSYHEGLSNVLLESAATGRPVIATKIPGCQEVFVDGLTGIGFRPKDQEALIKAVEKFILLPYAQKKQMGNEARKKVLKEYDRKQVIVAYLDAINIY